MAHTPGPWFVSGVRFRMNGGEWHSINRYDEQLKRDENIACVGYDPRTGAGLSDAHLIAAAPQMRALLSRAIEWLPRSSPFRLEIEEVLSSVGQGHPPNQPEQRTGVMGK